MNPVSSPQFQYEEMPALPSESIPVKRKVQSEESESKRIRQSHSQAIQEDRARNGSLRWTPEDVKTLVEKMTSTPAPHVEDIASELGRTAQSCRNKYQEIQFNQKLMAAIDPESILSREEISSIKNKELDEREEGALITMFQKGLTTEAIALELKRSDKLCKRKIGILKLSAPTKEKKSETLRKKIKKSSARMTTSKPVKSSETPKGEVILPLPSRTPNPAPYVLPPLEVQLESLFRVQKMCASLLNPNDVFIDTGKLYEDRCDEKSSFLD
jgi:hypothetical protein